MRDTLTLKSINEFSEFIKQREKEKEEGGYPLIVDLQPQEQQSSITDNDMLVVVNLLSSPGCPYGMRMSFRGNDMSGKLMQILSDFFTSGKCKPGIAFDLAYTGLIDEDVEMLSNGIIANYFPPAISFDLSNNSITDIGFEFLFAAFLKCKGKLWDIKGIENYGEIQNKKPIAKYLPHKSYCVRTKYQLAIKDNPIFVKTDLQLLKLFKQGIIEDYAISYTRGHDFYRPSLATTEAENKTKQRYTNRWFKNTITLFQGHRQNQSPFSRLASENISQIAEFLAPNFFNKSITRHFDEDARAIALRTSSHEDKELDKCRCTIL